MHNAHNIVMLSSQTEQICVVFLPWDCIIVTFDFCVVQKFLMLNLGVYPE